MKEMLSLKRFHTQKNRKFKKKTGNFADFTSKLYEITRDIHPNRHCKHCRIECKN